MWSAYIVTVNLSLQSRRSKRLYVTLVRTFLCVKTCFRTLIRSTIWQCSDSLPNVEHHEFILHNSGALTAHALAARYMINLHDPREAPPFKLALKRIRGSIISENLAMFDLGLLIYQRTQHIHFKLYREDSRKVNEKKVTETSNRGQTRWSRSLREAMIASHTEKGAHHARPARSSNRSLHRARK
jgi:hypothetical protein